MSSEKSLWGTFSGADHLRPRPFVSDVLLYDLLVLPVPDGDRELEGWSRLEREPRVQQQLIEILGECALPVPWSLTDWTDAEIRDEIYGGIVAMTQQVASGVGRHQDPGNPDDPAFMPTRSILAEDIGARKMWALAAGHEVEAVVAYGSYRDFQRDRGSLVEAAESGRQPVFTFRWSFFVPDNSERTNDDLLRDAVELARTDEISDWRAAVQRWRRNSVLKGESDTEALRDIEALIKEYGEAARKKKISVRTRWGFAVAAAAAGSAAAFVPLVDIPAAHFGLGSLVSQHGVPKRLQTAAMFHEARRRFS
jgi:hypothetical protein